MKTAKNLNRTWKNNAVLMKKEDEDREEQDRGQEKRNQTVKDEKRKREDVRENKLMS
jgi:hypothetical protein